MTLKYRIAPVSAESPLTISALQKRRASALQRAKHFEQLARAERDFYQAERFRRRAARAKEIARECSESIRLLKTAPRE